MDGQVINEGDWISIDGTIGEVFVGALDTVVPDLSDPWLKKLLGWADEFRTLGVWANADYPLDAERARRIRRRRHRSVPDRAHVLRAGAHSGRAEDDHDRVGRGASRGAGCAAARSSGRTSPGLFRAMDGYPVIIRLIDPPLHEFLPAFEDLTGDLADLRIKAACRRGRRRAAGRDRSRCFERVEALAKPTRCSGLAGSGWES